MPCNRSLGRHERITDEVEYKEVIGRGTSVVGKRFKSYILIGRGLDRKAGFIAGKGVGRAHQRNRARRLLREAYRELKPSTRESGFKVVFIAGRDMDGAAMKDVLGEMRAMLVRYGLLKERDEREAAKN